MSTAPENAGWIKLYRKVWAWRFSPKSEHRPYTRFEAWVDLLLTANHEPRAVGTYLIERGQILTSTQKLAVRWRWSESKVRRFLATLEKPLSDANGNDFGSEIDKRTDRQATVITINNYETYQGTRRTDDAETDERETNARRTRGERAATNKKERTKDIEEPKKEGVSAGVRQVFDLYNEICISLPTALSFSPKRRKLITPHLKAHPDRDFWHAFFRRVEASDFLTGRKTDWRAPGLDWILKEDKFTKILEGGYDNNDNGTRSRCITRADYGPEEGGKVTV